MGRPRILYLTSCWPHDRAFGGQLRTLHIGRALQQIGDVTLVVVSPDAATEETQRLTAAEFQIGPAVRVELQPNLALSQKLRRAVDPQFLNVHGCGVVREDRERLLKCLPDFDLVWLSNSRTPNIVQQWHWPGSVLDVDDIPSTYQRTVWQNGAGLAEKAGAGAQMFFLRRREKLWLERFSALTVCSEADRQYLGGGDHVHVIPNGFVRPAREPRPQPVQPPRIGFIGLFSYPPNREGVNWFVRECWPRIKREIPDARLRMLGKDTDGPLKPAGADIDGFGWVEDPAAEIATWSAMIIPVRLGAGTRIKIADAFSRQCPVVATPLGAFGYDVQHGRELLLAGDPAGFAAACVAMIRDPQAAAAMAGRAYRTFLEKWTWEAIAPRVWQAAEDGLRRGRAPLTAEKS